MSFQVGETELKTKKQLLEAKEKALDANMARLDEIKSQKGELELLIRSDPAQLSQARQPTSGDRTSP